MFEAPPTAAMAGWDSVLVAVFMFVLGYLFVNAVLGERHMDPIIRIGLVLPGLLALSFVLMLIHIATDGWLFSTPGAVRTITAATMAILVALPVIRRGWRSRRERRRTRETPGTRETPETPGMQDEPARPATDPGSVTTETKVAANLSLWPALLGLLGTLVCAWIIWGRVVFEMLPAGTGGDTALHMGWVGQMLNGERLPSNALVGPIENAYPWVYHAVVAWLSAVTPGGRPFHALGPLQLLQVTGAVTALYAFGYAMWRRWYAGATTAVLGAIAGGFGWLAGAEPELVKNVRGPDAEVGKFFGDFLAKRPYNLTMHNLAPAYPREVAYALIPALLLFFGLALRTRRTAFLISAGCVLGLIGLTGGEAFIAAAALTAAFIVTAGGVGRLRAALSVGVPATVIYATWFVPLMVNYFKHDGFFDLSSLPVVLSPLQVVGAFGIVVPLGVLGAIFMIPRFRRDEGSRVALVYLVSIGLLTAVVIYTTGKLEGGGFETLGRSHRYFPMLFQALAICGGLGLALVLERVARFNVIPAVVIAAAVCYAAFASPWYASRLLPESIYLDPALVSALQGDDGPWMATLSPRTGDRCVVAVPGWMSNKAFSYTGYRMVWYVWTKPRPNSARVRWKDIYKITTPDIDRRADVARLTEGIGPKGLFDEAVERYGVDRIVVPQRFAGSPVYDGYMRTPADGPQGRPIVIVEVDDCGDAASTRY